MSLSDRLKNIKPNIDFKELESILGNAVKQGRWSLFEHEAYGFLEALGSETVPDAILLPVGQKATEEQLMAFDGEYVVLKIVSPTIVHKTEVRGVRIVENNPANIRSCWRRMLYEVVEDYARLLELGDVPMVPSYEGLAGKELQEAIEADIHGVLLIQYMPPDSEAFGNELIVGLRHSREFGMVLSAGLGGTDTELYAKFFRKNRAIVTAPTATGDGYSFFKLFRKTVSYQKLIGLTRGQKRIVSDEQLVECFAALIEVGKHFSSNNPDAEFYIDEFEVNPFAFTDFSMVPLDGLLHFKKPEFHAPPRPIDKIDKLLHPRNIGIIGVSPQRLNFGRIILGNILKAGFEQEYITIIHPDEGDIDGVKSVAGFSSLQEPVDLLVVAVSSVLVPEIMDEVLVTKCAETILLIPGGLGETEESKDRAIKLQHDLQAVRKNEDKGPLILGANSMGVISHPGRFDTWFLPEEKLSKQNSDACRRIAFISQSGAFMGTRMSRVPGINPKYLISIGNQTDLTFGDFIQFFSECNDIDVIGVYAEGFNDLDGAVFADGVRKSVTAGKDVVFYKAGRTPEGQKATSGHTASLAGDYAICEACLSQAGGVAAQTLEQFADILKLSAMFHGMPVTGNKIAGFSSAGFEAVGLADYLHSDDYSMELAELDQTTINELSLLMKRNGLASLVTVQNPLDINPGADDSVFSDAASILAGDPTVDSIIAGLVPITPKLHSISNGSVAYKEGIYKHIQLLKKQVDKPLVFVVDGGRVFDSFVDDIEDIGFPVFRSIDRAVTALSLYTTSKLFNQ